MSFQCFLFHLNFSQKTFEKRFEFSQNEFEMRRANKNVIEEGPLSELMRSL